MRSAVRRGLENVRGVCCAGVNCEAWLHDEE